MNDDTLITLKPISPETFAREMGWAPKHAAFEKELHSAFSKHRKSGEWFRDHSGIRDFISSRAWQCVYGSGA